MLRPTLAALLAPALLGGCAALGALGQASRPLDAYELQAPATGPVARGRPQAIDLIVEVPSASGAIDTDRILIRPEPTQVQYLPDARWVEAAPVMLQSALVAGLERSGGFRYVGRRPLGSSGDLALVSNLAAFHAALAPGAEGATVEVRLTVRLVREEDAEVVATRSFAATAPAADTATETLVAAYDRATAEAVAGIVVWVLTTRGIRADAAPQG